jgi:two-component system, cell cycle sensor histidine kinase and response regulator CckA
VAIRPQWRKRGSMIYDWHLAALLAGVVILIVAVAVMWREMRQRQRAEALLQLAHRELDARMAARTAELDAASMALARDAELLGAVVQGAAAAIIGLDLQKRVLLWNPAAERMFGYTAAEVIGRPYPLVPPELVEEHAMFFARIASGERISGESTRRRRKDGRLIDLMFSAAPLHEVDGRLRGMVFVIDDVTDRMLADQRLRRSQRMEAIGQLTGGLAHDFNNLLTVVIGNLDLAAEQIEGQRGATECIDAALGAALRGAELTRRLLAFARQQPLQPTGLDLAERLLDLSVLLRRTLGEQVEIVLHTAPDTWPVMADPAQLADAVLNLAINARDAMPSGGRLTIETENARLDAGYAEANPEVVPGDYVLLALTDTGRGMPAQVLERVFEPFFTTKEAGNGTGLGLAQVYGFARQSNGHVKVYSEADRGTTVQLYLPRAGGRQAATQAAPPDAPRTGSESILLVEDNEPVRTLLEQQLGELGYRVTVAESTEAAVRLVRDRSFDLLLSDVVMPGGMSGYDLARVARRMAPGLRVLLISGFSANAPVDDGAYPLLRKPFRKPALAAKLRDILDAPPR